MAKRIAVLTVFKKMADLRVGNRDSLLGVEDEIQYIESNLKKYQWLIEEDQLREIIYDVEDVIDELIMRSVRSRNILAFLHYVSAFVVLPQQLYFVLALLDLLHLYKRKKLLEQVKLEKPLSREKKGEAKKEEAYFPWQWQPPFSQFNLNLGCTIISPVIRKFEDLALQKQLSPSLRKQARWLRDEFTSLQGSLHDIDSRELSDEAMAWIEELCDVCRSAENVVGLFELAQMQNGGGVFKSLVWAPHNFISQHKIVQQMIQIQSKVRGISRRSYAATRIRDPYSDYFASIPRECGISADELDAVSFEEDLDAIKTVLLKDDPRCLKISIAGLGGIGKTSLTKLIFHNEAVIEHFPHRFWISGANSMEQILDANTSQEWCKENMGQKVLSLLADRKFLIVVDHSVVSVLWNQIGGVFKDMSNGTRIIFLIRNMKEGLQVSETNFTYRLHLRSNKQSWALFKHSLKTNIPPELEAKLKTEILRKCGGLPKVIVKLGNLLSQSDATSEEWSRVLEHLIQDKEPWSEVLRAINLYMPLYLRRCLFHFGLFPIGYKIPARRLIALWVAEGIRDEQNSKIPPDYLAEICLRELINCNIVQTTQKFNGKVKTCCLPEALRRHWFSKAQETNNRIGVTRYLIDHLDRNDGIFDHIHGSRTTSLHSCYRETVAFLSFDTREESRAGEDIGNFLDRCISSNCFLFLWVLDLERVYKPKLPKAVDQLTQLRYLGLRWTYMEKLPMFISKLLNLQSFDIKHTSIKTLPASIWKMQKLKYLFLDETSGCSFVPQQEHSSLLDLQTLRGVYVDEDSPVRNGLDTMLNVTKLGLKCKISVPSKKEEMSSQLVAVANWIMNLRDLQYLKLKSYGESSDHPHSDILLESLSGSVHLSIVYLAGRIRNPRLLTNFPKNLRNLTLSASGLMEDPMQIIDKLPKLRVLRLLSRSFMGKRMHCNFGGFPKLEVLQLWELVHFEDWEVEAGALCNLTELEMRSCRNLKMLPDGLQHIKSLRELKLRKVPMLSSRVKDNQGEDWNKVAHVRHVCIED
ncbi:disease resistance RPP8-like protein 3 [Mercurialis annua]|uniref:disease resistance RPP8-like protein 3 n=1 Tax=Mercurialis annua TaxID=3986 RepID=UPI0021609575|nr:disease resistance RPP8-like protein 3 [Mercurialis annua]